MPLVVPPGGHATGVSVDKLGNQQRRDIDLGAAALSAPAPRRRCRRRCPPTASARAEVVAFAVDARGHPERRAPPPLAASAGTLVGAEAARRRLDDLELHRADARSTRARSRCAPPAPRPRIALRPGPPRAIEVLAPKEPLPAGLDAVVTVDVRVRDADGSPVTGATLTAALAGGRVIGTSERGNGLYAVELVPPRDAGRGTALLHVEVAGVTPGPPRRVTLHPVARAGGAADKLVAEAWIDDDVGLPVPGARVELAAPGASATVAADRYGTARVDFAPPAARSFRVTAQPAELPGVAAALDYLVVGGVVHAVGSVAGGGVVESGEPPSFPSVDTPLPLRPAAPLDLRLSVEPPRPTRRASGARPHRGARRRRVAAPVRGLGRHHRGRAAA